MANSSLVVSSLDFDTLKNNLKTYLKSQSVFKDYDYEGSNMNVLLSLLSYNSYLNSFYLNMASAESFMDTAQIRDSVVSHAKTLNYIPSSAKSPVAVVNITFDTTGIGSVFTIPKGTQFSGSNANGSYVYVTDKVHTINSGNGTFFAEGVKIYEGSYFTETYVKDSNIESQKFVLSNENVDTDSIQITVYEGANTVGADYVLAESLYGVTNTSNVYFLQAFKNQYEVVFGDNVFGYSPLNGSTISVSYRITNGTKGGNINSFVLDNDLGTYNSGTATSTITVTTAGSSGSDAEGIESIRFRAPRAYQTQNRAITSEDYKTLIMNKFTEIKSLYAYGSENNIISGINSGKVIISPITYSGSLLSNVRKQEIIKYITDKMTIGLTPIIIDPEIIYISPRISVLYDPTQTNLTQNSIKALISNALQTYNNVYLNDFNNLFVKSNLINYLLDLDSSIVSVDIDNYLEYVASPETGKLTTISINLDNRIVPTNITSTQFLRSDGVFYKFTDYNPNVTVLKTEKNDSGVSVLSSTSNKLYLVSQNTTVPNYIETGVIDYENGIIKISDLNVVNFADNAGITFYFVPFNDNILATKNKVTEFNLSTTQINVNTI